MFRFCCGVWLLLLAYVAAAQSVRIPPLPQGGFVVDEAGVLSAAVKQQINQIAYSAKTDISAPIMVVTIPSLHAMNAGMWPIESYAMHLFNSWGIGSKKINKGVLILVSPGDRKARIELGADWGHTRDAECEQIMNDWMVPKFKQGDYSGGILAGIQQTNVLLRTGKASRPVSAFLTESLFPMLFIGAVVLVFILSIFFSGRRLYRDDYYDDGYYGGGSSGGSSSSGSGSSGGGGATGSW